jgi:hypothetical protein
MSNVTNNLTLEDVVRHLTSIRVSDAGGSGSLPLWGWLGNLHLGISLEEEATTSSDILQHLRLLPPPIQRTPS